MHVGFLSSDDTHDSSVFSGIGSFVLEVVNI